MRYTRQAGQTKAITDPERRERMESPGLLLQMDGSPHRWFGNHKSCLIAIIDDATSEVHAEFFESETTLGCLKVLRDFIARKGLV